MGTKRIVAIIIGLVIVAVGFGITISKRRSSVVFENPLDRIIANKPAVGTFKMTVSGDVCSDFPKEWVQAVTGKSILRTENPGGKVTTVCQYYVDDHNFLTLRLNNLSFENQKKGQEALGRTISANNTITMEHFIAVQSNGLINGVYLAIHPNQFLAVDRSSSKALSEAEIVKFAKSVGDRIQGGEDVSSTKLLPTAIVKTQAPMPVETDILRSFFAVIGEHRPSDAVSMLSPEQTSDDSKKQAWAVQFNAFSSLKVTGIEPVLQEDWTDSRHEYKVTMDVTMKPESASAPIPNYGWENGSNMRWITLVKEGSLWKISEIATSP